MLKIALDRILAIEGAIQTGGFGVRSRFWLLASELANGRPQNSCSDPNALAKATQLVWYVSRKHSQVTIINIAINACFIRTKGSFEAMSELAVANNALRGETTSRLYGYDNGATLNSDIASFDA